MKRTVIQRANVSGAPLTELKSWLGISRATEDGQLVGLIEASLSLCEGFTGQIPLLQTIEERFNPIVGRQRLTSRPVQSILSVELEAQDGTRSPLGADRHEIEFDAQGSVCVHLHGTVEGRAVVVRATAGIATDWASVPGPVQQGTIRMAAHLYRERDRDSQRERLAAPPASVAALWRPWRSLRIA